MKFYFLILVMLFRFNSNSQNVFNGVANYKTSYNDGRVLKSRVYFSDSAICVIQDSLASKDGFDRFLLKIEDAKVVFYQINTSLNVALKDEISNNCGYYTSLGVDSSGFGKMKVEGNPSVDQTSSGHFSAEYLYDKKYSVLPKECNYKCFPLMYFINGYLIVKSQSEVNFGTERKSIGYLILEQLVETKIPETVFRLPESMQVEKYSVQRMGQLTFLYGQLHKNE